MQPKVSFTPFLNVPEGLQLVASLHLHAVLLSECAELFTEDVLVDHDSAEPVMPTLELRMARLAKETLVLVEHGVERPFVMLEGERQERVQQGMGLGQHLHAVALYAI